MLAEMELGLPNAAQQVADWVRKAGEARHVPIVIREEQIEERRGQYTTSFLVPVDIPSLEPAAFLETLSDISSEWNDRDPYPEKFLLLYPAGVPEHVV